MLVHVSLYSLRPIDIEFIKTLDKCVNIVPVIAKSDTMTIEERESFKRRVNLILCGYSTASLLPHVRVSMYIMTNPCGVAQNLVTNKI